MNNNTKAALLTYKAFIIQYEANQELKRHSNTYYYKHINLSINAKDDQILCPRKGTERFLFEQREGSRLILEKLDKVLEELKSMRSNNKILTKQF